MKSLRVATHHGGSVVVVFKNNEHYIDARKDVRTPNYTHIEYVRDGYVRQRRCELDEDAPATIVAMIKEFFL